MLWALWVSCLGHCVTQISNTLFLQYLANSGIKMKQKDWVSTLQGGSEPGEQCFHQVCAFLRPPACKGAVEGFLSCFGKAKPWMFFLKCPLTGQSSRSCDSNVWVRSQECVASKISLRRKILSLLPPCTKGSILISMSVLNYLILNMNLVF